MYPLRSPQTRSDGLLAMHWARVPGRPSKSLRSVVGWSLFWGAFGVVDNLVPVSFSQTLRDVFDTDTPEGRTAFLVSLTVVAVTFAVHIIHKK